MGIEDFYIYIAKGKSLELAQAHFAKRKAANEACLRIHEELKPYSRLQVGSSSHCTPALVETCTRKLL